MNIVNEDKKKDQKLKQLEKNLTSDKDSVVLSAIKKLRDEGNEKFIPILIETMVTTESTEVEKEIIAFLNDLKNTASAPYLIEAIKNDDYTDYKSILIGIFWQSSLDASEHLAFLVEQAIEGDFMTAFEAVTVIENLDGTFTESEIMDATYTISENIENIKGEKKKLLLLSLQETLKNLKVEY